MKKLIIIALSASLLAACAPDYDSPEVATVTTSQKNPTSSYKTLVEDKMFYIKNDPEAATFHITYSAFLEAHPELEVFDIETKPAEGTYNEAEGYFIFTKDKE